MKRKIKDLNFLLLFARSKHLSNDSPIKRFVQHVLFDVHLISMMYDCLRFPLVAPFHFGSFGRGDMQFQHPNGLCIHPITGHLWVADTVNRRLCIYQIGMKVSLIRTVECNGDPMCIRISKTGYIVIIVWKVDDDHLAIFDEKYTKICCKLDQRGLPEGLAINNALQQIAISDQDLNCITLYTMNGIFLRTLTTEIQRPTGICWNEKDPTINNCIHVIDTRTDTCIAIWNGVSNPRGMMYRHDSGVGQVLIADLGNNRVVVMNAENGTRIHSYAIRGHGRDFCGYPCDVAFHPYDTNNQLFICDAEYTIQAIQMLSL